MLRSTHGAFLPPLGPAHGASDSEPPFTCISLKELRREGGGQVPQVPQDIRSTHIRIPRRSSSRTKVEHSNCLSSVVETITSDASASSSFPDTSPFSSPRSMWQEAIRRKRYLLDRAGEGGKGGQERRKRSQDWLYESYYCMSQQHPLIVFLLLIVMGACLALLAVFFASGLVSSTFMHVLCKCERTYSRA